MLATVTGLIALLNVITTGVRLSVSVAPSAGVTATTVGCGVSGSADAPLVKRHRPAATVPRRRARARPAVLTRPGGQRTGRRGDQQRVPVTPPPCPRHRGPNTG